MQFIDLAAQYRSLKSRIDARIQSVLEHGQYILGPEVNELEDRLADYVGVKHAITCANGTDALQLALMALGIKEGDAVFCPTFTFFASAEAISFVGATPIFVDIDATTFNISPADLESKIQSVKKEGRLRPKAVMAVDLFGLPADYPKIETIAQKHNLIVIEDGAQGFGGEIDGRKACSFGDAATTSFFPAKPLGCYGDGGAIFTDDDQLACLLRSLRVHGKGSDKYDNVRIGMNSRLDTIQAAILLEKLLVLPEEIGLRNEFAKAYSDALSTRYEVPNVPGGYVSAWAQYTLRHNERDILMARLSSHKIPSVIYYNKCMHQQSAFSHLPEVKLGVAEEASNTVFSLPMHPYLNSADIQEVICVLLGEK